MRLAISERATVAYRDVNGVDHHKVVVVDEILADPDRVREHALRERFEPPRDVLYPGEVASPDWDFGGLKAMLEQIIGRGFSPAEVTFRLSMLAADGRDLLPAQRRPHADGCLAAGVLFLNPPAQCVGGTGFYRHAATGFEWFPDPESPHHARAAAARGFTLQQVSDALRMLPVQSSGFIRESTTEWELVELVEMKHNRFVLYEGNLFHSAFVADGEFGSDPGSRRLTLNVFVQSPPS